MKRRSGAEWATKARAFCEKLRKAPVHFSAWDALAKGWGVDPGTNVLTWIEINEDGETGLEFYCDLITNQEWCTAKEPDAIQVRRIGIGDRWQRV